MLSGLEILNQIEKGNIVIEPFNKEQLNPNSYNIRLGNKLLVYKNTLPARRQKLQDGSYKHIIDSSIRSVGCLDSKKENETIEIIIPEEGYILEPGILYLGETEEYTETINLVPCIDGRSSIGRLGVQVHATAGFGDNGFKGKWTLEITTTHRVRIYPGIQIGQIYYETLEGDSSMVYNGKYQNQDGVIASRIQKDYTEK